MCKILFFDTFDATYVHLAYLLIYLILILLHPYIYFAFTHFFNTKRIFFINDDIKPKWFHHRKLKEIYNLETITTQED